MASLPLNIQRMRRDEERHQVALFNVRERDRVEGIVSFEHRTERQITDRLVRQRVAEANKKLRARVDERRAALARLLESERFTLQRDIEASFDTPEAVKEKLFAHARRLKEEREAARRALAAELEDKRFRLSSDALRARASAITAERTALDRVEQLQHKARVGSLDAAREREEMERAAADAREFNSQQRVLAEARRRIAAETAAVLDQQTAVRRDLTAAEQAFEDAQVQRMLEADRAAAEAQRAAEVARREHARVEYERVQAYNAKERGAKGGAAAREAAGDKANLDAVLAREAAEAEAEQQARLDRRRAGIEFKKQLEAQMGVAAEDQSWMDRFYQEEFDKEWAKRQSQWDREAAARKALLDEVTQGRLAQMADKGRQGEAERRRDEAQMAAFARGRAEDERKAAEKEAKRREGLRNQAVFNRQELEANASRLEAEKQAAYLEWRLQKKFDAEYEAKMQRLLDTASVSSSHGIKKQNLW